MKALHLLPSLDSGGMETFVISLTRQQIREGLNSSIAVFSGNGERPRKYESHGITVWEFNRGIGMFRLGKELRTLIRRENFELLHSHNETSTIFGAIAMWGLPQKALISTIHNGDRAHYSLKQRLEDYLAFRRCGVIVTVTEQIAATMVSREFVRASRLRVIKNGIESIEPASEAQKNNLKKSLGVFGSTLIVGCVGRLVPVKNHLLFLEAFKEALAAFPDMVLVLVGDGPLRGELEVKARVLEINTSIRLLGDRKDVPMLLNIMDIFALPSLNEGHSISLLEACSAGRAVLASNRGGNPTLVQDGKSGILFEPENVAEMVKAIVSLAENPQLRVSMGTEGKKIQRELYGIEACSRNYRNLYTSLFPFRTP